MLVFGFWLALLLVFGGQPGSSDAFSAVSPKSPPAFSDEESVADIFTGLLPLTQDTSELDTIDITETAHIKDWNCHRHYCYICFDVEHHTFCITVTTRSPTGFFATATVNAQRFLHKAFTAPGVGYAYTRHVPGYGEIKFFYMGFYGINPKLRSAAGVSVVYKISGKFKLIKLGKFQIPANDQSQERESLTSMFDWLRPLSPDTNELQETSETHNVMVETTETAEITNWICHPYYCFKTIVINHHTFWIGVVFRKPTGFYAVAVVNGKRFLFKAFTAPGYGYIDTRHVPGCKEIHYFELAFVSINPRSRSAKGYVLFKIQGKAHIIALGEFRIPVRYGSEEGDNLKFRSEASLLDEAMESEPEE